MNAGLELEEKILLWVKEEIVSFHEHKAAPAVSTQLLMMRLALEERGEEQLTGSTEISLQAFDRANLSRVLRILERKKLLFFTTQSGMPLGETEYQALLATELEKQPPVFVRLSEKGEDELLRLMRSGSRLAFKFAT